MAKPRAEDDRQAGGPGRPWECLASHSGGGKVFGLMGAPSRTHLRPCPADHLPEGASGLGPRHASSYPEAKGARRGVGAAVSRFSTWPTPVLPLLPFGDSCAGPKSRLDLACFTGRVRGIAPRMADPVFLPRPCVPERAGVGLMSSHCHGLSSGRKITRATINRSFHTAQTLVGPGTGKRSTVFSETTLLPGLLAAF